MPQRRAKLANPDGPEASDSKPPNSHQHPVVKRKVSRGTKIGLAKNSSKRHPHGKKSLRERRQQTLSKIRDQAVKNGLVEHGLAPIQVLQRLIDDAFIDYAVEYHKREQALQDDPQARYPESKLQRLRREAAYYASIALQYNIGDRMARQQEIRTQLLATLLQQVLRDPAINLSEAKIRKVPKLLEHRAEILQNELQAGDNGHRHTPPHQLAS